MTMGGDYVEFYTPECQVYEAHKYRMVKMLPSHWPACYSQIQKHARRKVENRGRNLRHFKLASASALANWRWSELFTQT